MSHSSISCLILFQFVFTVLAEECFSQSNNLEYIYGAVVRTDTSKKIINLVFTGHEYADGFNSIKFVLDKQNIKASFFFTGDFYSNKNFSSLIQLLKDDGHYLGAHSDKHLLYASWDKRDSTLISKEEFISDLMDNYSEMEKFGISRKEAKYFLPPFEWYNYNISDWCKELGITLINFTAGTSSNQDWSYTELGDKYFSSDSIYNKILSYEETTSSGLNGFILLTHIGTDPRRTDKFYLRLDELISELIKRGYSFKTLNETIGEF